MVGKASTPYSTRRAFSTVQSTFPLKNANNVSTHQPNARYRLAGAGRPRNCNNLHASSALQVGRQFFPDGLQELAMTAPRSKELDQPGPLSNVLVKRSVGQNHDISCERDDATGGNQQQLQCDCASHRQRLQARVRIPTT